MTRKDNSTMHIVLISLVISMVITYLFNFKYKDDFVSSFSEAVYYQFITWISLAQPLFVAFFYKKIRRRYYLIKRSYFIWRHGGKIDVNKLSPSHKKMYEQLKGNELTTSQELTEIFNELSKFEK